jgi:hypothetical protein
MHKVILAAEQHRQRAVDLVRKAPLGFVVTIAEQRRSNAQNDKMWAMLSEISVAKPQGRCWKPEQWKAAFMDACGHQPTYQETLEGGSFICTGYRSSLLTVAQMRDIIECMNAYMAEHEIPTKGDAGLA